LGSAQKTCGFYKENAVGKPLEFYFESWAAGALSTLNNFHYEKDILKEADPEAISAALKLYCDSHPLDSFAVAVLNVADQLADRTPDGPTPSASRNSNPKLKKK
jgi:hypothetical protein